MGNKKILSKVSLGLWLCLLLGGVLVYFMNPEKFTAEGIAESLNKFQGYIAVIYLLVHIIRGFFLFPSTPLIFAGILLFPNQELLVVILSIVGITLSSSLIYFFSDYWGFNDFFERKYANKIDKIKDRIEKPSGLIFIIFWSFFPIVPTDLVSYIAGSIQMNFWKFIGAVFLGEVILCFACVYGGSALFH